MKFSYLTKNFEIFIFDFDGVILDSVDIKNKFFRKFFLEYGVEIGNLAYNHHIKNLGISRYDKIDFVYNNFIKKKLDINTKKKILENFSNKIIESIQMADFISGVKNLLINLKKNNKKCFIISATPFEELEKIVNFKNLNGFFLKLYGSPKKKIQNYNELSNEFGISSKKSVYFGDTINDLKFAKQKNINFISIGKNLLEYSDDYMLTSLIDFREIVY